MRKFNYIIFLSRFASRTRARVGRAFSFNKTPSKLNRAMSTIMSPFGVTQTLPPTNQQIAQMRLGSCNNISVSWKSFLYRFFFYSCFFLSSFALSFLLLLFPFCLCFFLLLFPLLFPLLFLFCICFSLFSFAFPFTFPFLFCFSFLFLLLYIHHKLLFLSLI